MKGFPIHPCDRGNKNPLGLEYIPWEAIQSHEAQAINNHGQSLEILAKRHGLSFYEMYCVLSDIQDVENAHKYSAETFMYAVLKRIGIFYCGKCEKEDKLYDESKKCG